MTIDLQFCPIAARTAVRVYKLASMNPLPITSNESIVEGFYAYMDSLGRAPLTKESYRTDVRSMVDDAPAHPAFLLPPACFVTPFAGIL